MEFYLENKNSKIFTCGKALLNGVTLEIHKGSVLEAHVLGADCIVNAANKSLNHNGGLAGTIASLAGQALEEDCSNFIKRHRSLSPCQVFSSTSGKFTDYKRILHVAGPIVENSYIRYGQEEELTNCILNSILKANQEGLTSIAFPGISCGIFGFPKKEAAVCHLEGFSRYAEKIRQGLKNSITNVHFFLFSNEECQMFTKDFFHRAENDQYDYSNFIGTPEDQSGALLKYCGCCGALFENNYFRYDRCHFNYCDFCVYRYNIKNCYKCKMIFDYIDTNFVYCRVCRALKGKDGKCCLSCNNICGIHWAEKCVYCEKKLNS